MNTCGYICYHILCKSTISLPSISASFRLLTINEESFPTFITISTSLNMINNNSVSFLEVKNTFSHLYNLSAWLMTCNHIVISCASGLVCMFMINILQVTSTKAGCFHFKKYLSISRLRNILLYLLYSVSSRKLHTYHFFW